MQGTQQNICLLLLSYAPYIHFFVVLMVKVGLNCDCIADGHGHVRLPAQWPGQGTAHNMLCKGLQSWEIHGLS